MRRLIEKKKAAMLAHENAEIATKDKSVIKLVNIAYI